MARILIIDDNDTMREGMAATVRRLGHEVDVAPSGVVGVAKLKKAQFDLVITDLKMDGMTGMAVLEAVRELDASIPTLIVTAFGTVEAAVEAMRLGALDFLQKPFAPEVLRLKVQRGLDVRQERVARVRAEAEVEALRSDANTAYGFGELVGRSPLMQNVFTLIEKVAARDVPVHIHGESGTGKELVARALHVRSRRKDKPFVKVNCGALAETLLESELFGHEKGSFTGAVKRKLGRFELAHEGTLFLDEVGDMSPGLQVKLLRVLQEQEFERVGGEESVKVDVRVISATHRDLKTEVEAGRFREDLYYRMHVVACEVPALRDHREDIPLLVEHFVRKQGPRLNPKITSVGPDALARLCGYNWPGNVRELENAIEQALVFAEGTVIEVDALPPVFRQTSPKNLLPLPAGDRTLPEILEELERQLILRAYDETKGVKTETARKLGIKTSALYYKLEKYGIGVIAGRDAEAAEADEGKEPQ